MSYATKQDIIDSYGETAMLTAFNWENVDEKDFDDSVIDKALENASSEIDGYLGGRYTLPLEIVPSNLVSMCVDIAIYKGSGLSGAAQTEEKRQRYEDAIKYLTDVAKGTISINVSSGDGGGGGGGSSFSANSRIFTRSGMSGMI